MTDKKNNKNQTSNLIPYHGSEKLLNHIQTLFGKNMKDIMVIYFEYVDSYIFKMAENADSHHDQRSYFESLKSIRVHKFNVLTSFLTTIKQTFKYYEAKNFDYFETKITEPVSNKTITESIDKNDIEEKLAQNTLVQRFDGVYQEDLIAFKRRFTLLIGHSLEPHHIPVCPYVLILSFAKSIRLLHLDLEIKLVLYKLFESNVLDKIEVVYQDINKYLHDNGIVPGIKNQILTEKFNKESKEEKRLQPSSKEQDEPLKNYKSIYDVLLNLQIKLIKDLSDASTLEISPIDIKNALFIQFKRSRFKNKGQILGQSDKDAINLITMMFQLVSGDRNIPTEFKLLLTKLHIPFIKAAMLDKSLLTNKQHPAQVILTSISKASIGWNKEKDKNNNFINNASKVIANIVEEEKLDQKFFTKQLNGYQKFINEQKNEFKIEQNRIENKLKGRDRIVNAMKAVEALLNHKTHNVELPTLIHKMLYGARKNVLVLILVRHSDTSDEYLLKINFIDDLIETIQSEKYEIILKKIIEKLSLEYAEGLKLVAYDGDGLIAKVNEFSQCLLNIHKIESESNEEDWQEKTDDVPGLLTAKAPDDQSKIKISNTKVYSKDSDRDSPNVSEEPVKKQCVLTGLNQKDKDLINKIPIGAWFEFKRGDKNPVKAQLSWISPKTGMYLFVNSRGLKVSGLLPKELVVAIRSKNIISAKK